MESSRAAFIDTEPARSDSIAPIFNIFRRILDSENKKQFNRLVGEEHAPIYESWWKENIAPIWEDINKNFRETTFFKKIMTKSLMPILIVKAVSLTIFSIKRAIFG